MAYTIKYQHGIIFSTYYSGRIKPGGLHDPDVTYDIDLFQLLLMMDLVFKAKHYSLIVGPDVNTVPEHRTAYQDNYVPLISTNPELRKHKILSIEERKHYRNKGYEKIKITGADRKGKNNLFYYNLLITYINCEKEIEERKPYSHFLLFDNSYQQQGILLINYLKNRLLLLVSQLCNSNEFGDPEELIQCMANDYRELESLYKSASLQLQAMARKTLSLERSLTDFFQNEAVQTKDYIKDHKKLLKTGSIIDFIFSNNKGYTNIALSLINHINRIAIEYKLGDLSNNWALCISTFDNKDVVNEMSNANKKLEELEEKGLAQGFDIIAWGNEYKAILKKVFQYI